MLETTITAEAPQDICQQWVFAAEKYLRDSRSERLAEDATVALFVDTAEAISRVIAKVGDCDIAYDGAPRDGIDAILDDAFFEKYFHKSNSFTAATINTLRFCAEQYHGDFRSGVGTQELEKFLLRRPGDMSAHTLSDFEKAVVAMAYTAHAFGVRSDYIDDRHGWEPLADGAREALRQRGAALLTAEAA